MNHELKTRPSPFQAIWDGQKTYEIRRNDRNFKVRDSLHLREWDPETKKYTGRWLSCIVKYMTSGGEWGLPDDLCVMSISVLCRFE